MHDKAARSFDAAMFCLRGRNATFNFPDNPPDIAGGRSMTPSQIQAAAAEFANGGAHEGCSGRPEAPSRDATVVETHNGSLTDLLTPVGSGNYGSEYGIFRGFDDLGGEFYVPEMANVSYGEDNGEGLIVDESFLWNF
ncbi:hypothetical protein Fmac_013253 [Flemingia macrophylla]|uniref:AP2/ERF domain-containing protein n=1 Tax=Flemingia macrophylla TaxID=520843 RepID=A0ABD1MTH1_9FABA